MENVVKKKRLCRLWLALSWLAGLAVVAEMLLSVFGVVIVDAVWVGQIGRAHV